MQHSITFSQLRLRQLGVAGCAFALFAMGACTDEAIVYPNRNLKPPAGGETSSDAGEAGMPFSGGTSAGGGGGLFGGGTGGSPLSLGGGDDLLDDGGSGGAAPLDQCGDGVVQPPEECDDKNRVSGDGCSAQCKSSCETCEKDVCPLWATSNVQDWYANCYQLKGNATTGAATGVPRAQLCAAALDCARAERCAHLTDGFADIRSCWCDADWSFHATGVNAAVACKAQPSDDPSTPSTFVKGKCYQEFTDASEATTSEAVLAGLTAVSKGFGAAFGLFMGCDRHLCTEECLPGFYSNEMLASIASDLTSTQNAAGESQLGDLVADAFRAAAKTDFALAASQTVASDGDNLWFKATKNRPADADGRVLRSEAVAVVLGYGGGSTQAKPEYTVGALVTGTYTGQQIYDALGEQFDAQSQRLLVSGLKYTWAGVLGQSPEPTIIEVRKSDGTLLDKAATYTVVTTVVLTGNGTSFPTLPKGANITPLPDGDPSEVWLAYLPKLPQPVAAPTLDRVTLQPSP